MGFGTKYTTNSLGSFSKPGDPQPILDCYKVLIIDTRLFKGVDPLSQESSYIGVGQATLECCCAPYLQVVLDNPPPTMEDVDNCCITGSIEEGNLRYLYVEIRFCCSPCATIYPGDAGGTVYNADCKCKRIGKGSKSFRFNTTPGLARRDMRYESEKAYFDITELGTCEGCSGF